MDKLKYWVKKKSQKVENYIFKPTFGFVHIWSKFGLKQPSIFRVYTYIHTHSPKGLLELLEPVQFLINAII